MARAAVESAERCYHWAEEVGAGDAEREKQIGEGIARDCPEAKRNAENAYQRFPENPQLAVPLLKLNDIGYFDLSDDARRKLCERGRPRLKHRWYGSKRQDGYFTAVCPDVASRASLGRGLMRLASWRRADRDIAFNPQAGPGECVLLQLPGVRGKPR